MIADVRRALTQVHRWFGLTAGLVAVYLAITGAWIVLRPQLDPLTYRALFVVPPCAHAPLPVDSVVAAARAAHPRGRMTYVYLSGSPTASTMVRFSDTDQVYVDGCTGRVLGHQLRYGGLYGTAEALHKMRFLPTSGAMAVIGTVSLLLATFLVIGGLIAWWPRRRSGWRHALAIDTRLKGRAFLLRVHTTTGVYASVVIFVVALTAVPLSLGWAKSTLFVLTHSADMTEDAHRPLAVHARPKARAAAAVTSHLPLQTAWAAARRLVGGPFRWGSLHRLDHGGPIEVGIVAAAAPHGDARNYVFVDPRTGAIVEFRPWATLNAGSKLYYWALAVHTGRAGGPAVQLLMLFGMLGLCAIAYTGIDGFIRKSVQRARKNAGRERALTLRFER